MATIYDVAQAAGVSITTVSRVLNGSERVSDGTRSRVQAAMKALSYSPNTAARSLTLGQRRIVALVVPDIANPFYADLARGMQDLLDAHEYGLLIASTDGRIEKELAVVHGFKRQRVDGICLVRYLIDASGLQLASELRLPTVSVGSRPAELPLDHVGTFGSGRALRAIVGGLVANGRRRLAHVAGPGSTVAGEVRLRQYEQLVRHFGLARDAQYVLAGVFTQESGFELGKRLFALEPAPDMIFAANDVIAVGVMEAAEAAGVAIPGDVAIIGCDDIPLAAHLRPSLTSLRMPSRALGREAAELLVRRFEQPDAVVRDRALEVVAVERASTRLAGVRREAL